MSDRPGSVATRVHEGAGAGQAARPSAWSSAITATTDRQVFVRGVALDEAIGRGVVPGDAASPVARRRRDRGRGGAAGRLPGGGHRPRPAGAVGAGRADDRLDAGDADERARRRDPVVRRPARCRRHPCDGDRRHRSRPTATSSDGPTRSSRPSARPDAACRASAIAGTSMTSAPSGCSTSRRSSPDAASCRGRPGARRPCRPMHVGHPVAVNIDGALAVALTALRLDPEYGDFLFAIARSFGLAAHIVEERARERPMRMIDPDRRPLRRHPGSRPTRHRRQDP